MQTGGYDLVAQISDKLINKSLAIAYYLGKFPVLKDKYTLPVDVPDYLKDFTEIIYEIELTDPPVYRAQANGQAGLTFKGQAKVVVLGGIQVGTEAEIKINLIPSINREQHTLAINFADSEIENLVLTGFTDIAAETTERLKSALSQSITRYLREDVGTVDLTPAMLAGEQVLGVNIDHVGVSAPFFNVAGNVLQREGGSANRIDQFCRDNHIAVGITADAMHRIYDHWWDQTPSPKTVTKGVSHTFKFDFLPEWVDTIDNWISELALGGFFSVDVDVTGIRVQLEATMTFSKFSFEMKENNRIEVSGGLILYVAGDIDALYTKKTRVLLYSKTDKGSKNLVHVDLPPTPIIIGSATAELDIDPRHRLVAKVKEVHAEIPLLIPVVPDFVTQYIKDKILSSIGEFVGSIALSPTIIEEELPGTDLTIRVEVNNFTSNQQEAIVGVKTKTLGAKDYAPYICHTGRSHKEAHKRTCQHAQKILPKNRAYYVDLQEALDDGYDGCSYCLNDYHTR